MQYNNYESNYVCMYVIQIYISSITECIKCMQYSTYAGCGSQLPDIFTYFNHSCPVCPNCLLAQEKLHPQSDQLIS